MAARPKSQGRLAVGTALLAIVLSTTSCAVNGLAFREDERLRFAAPEDRSLVRLPFEVRWSIADFEVGPGGGSFALFIDRAPQRPGRTLTELYDGSEACRGVVGCPDASFLANRNVYSTTERSFDIETVPARSEGDRRRYHELTVVLLDEQGRRIGESAWTLEFEVWGE